MRAARHLVVVIAVLLIAPASAGAAISPSTVLDGPSADILEVGGTAMAPDGTGGVVYRRRGPDGRSHIYAAQFIGGTWRAPQRVDVGQAFDSTWPRIAAGSGGKLTVVWVQEYGPGTDRLYSARLTPGAKSFAAPVSIDLAIGEATATWPTVVMNSGGQTMVFYRVITRAATTIAGAGVPAGYVQAELRGARYRGPLWSAVGVLSRNTSSYLPPPTADNAPSAAIDVRGNGLIAWAEPDNNRISRIWSRRFFSGGGISQPLLVSDQVVAGKVVPAADQPQVATAGNGAGVVVYRQDGAGIPAFGGRTRVMRNVIGDVETDGSLKFSGAAIVDATTSGSSGSPTVGMDEVGDLRIGLLSGSTAALVADTGGTLGAPLALDGAASGPPVVTDSPDGGTIAVWPRTVDGRAGVAISERPGTSDPLSATVAGAAGGPISDLQLGGSGQGDALVAFRQGRDDSGQVVVADVDGPPQPQTTIAATDWIRPSAAKVSWEPAIDAIGGVRYAVVLDGQIRAADLTGTQWVPPADSLDDGTYNVAVLVTDAAGQRRLSDEATLRVDGSAPQLTVSARGRTVAVRAVDGASGIAAGDLVVRWGDGSVSRGARTARHTFRRAGARRITVRATDRAGNVARTARTVSAR